MRKIGLGDLLADNTREGRLFETLAENQVKCFACANRCVIAPGKSGICRVRFNQGGKLRVPFGYVAGLHADPIEKKPFFHALPGALAMSFGMLGCNFHCPFCQNWLTSYTLKDPEAFAVPSQIEAGEIVNLALKNGCRLVTSTYNEPLITSEWAVEIFREAKRHGLLTAFVSNGHATPEALDELRPWLDLYKVDLKCFDEKHYRAVGGTLSAVCETIKHLHDKGFWVEVVTLLIPGFNDSEEEILRLTKFLASVSRDIPWHCTSFHPDYEMTDRAATPVSTLIRAAEIGRHSGLRYVYAGNIPGHVGTWENTYCHQCGELLIRRHGFDVLEDKINAALGKCPKCGTKIPGVWDKIRFKG